jgi:hypothetical protein
VSKPNEESAFESAQAQTSRDLDYISFTEGWRAALAAAQPAGPSATEIRKAVDDGVTVSLGDSHEATVHSVMERIEPLLAAQPKAPSPSEDEPPECGCCGMVCYGDTCSGCGWERKAPSPTPGEVESGSPMNAGSLANVLAALEPDAELFVDGRPLVAVSTDGKGRFFLYPSPAQPSEWEAELIAAYRQVDDVRFDRALALLRAALPAQGWLPIEQYTGDQIVVLWDGHRTWTGSQSHGGSWSSYPGNYRITPTHFMRIPERPTPPNAEPGERSGE